MKKESAIILMTTLMIFSAFAPMGLSTGPTQPPVDTTTLYVGTIAWGPRRADPVRAYDSASGELIFNTYDTLIAMGENVRNTFNPLGSSWNVAEQYWAFSPSLSTNVPDRLTTGKGVTSADVVVTNPTGSTWSDDSTCVGWVDNNPDGTLGAFDVIYLIESDGSYRTWQVHSFSAGPPVSVALNRYSYTFSIRTVDGLGNPINFYDSTGASVDTLDVADAQYSFQRGLVQDQYGSPMWMFYKPFFDQMNSDFWDNSTSVILSHLIDNAVEVSGGDLILNLGIPFPDIAFKQILAQTWGSMVSKEWAVGKGCWNGNLFEDLNADGIPDWFINWRHKTLSPIQSITPTNYAGTGPYHVITASAALNLVVLQRNPGYWGGWPAPGRKAYLEFVDIEYIADWTTRRESLKAGQLDVAAIPRSNIMELLDPADPARMTPIIPGIKTIKNISPALSEDNLFFTFTVDPTSPALYTGSFPNGAPFDFFNNVHIRRAFAYAFNHTKYLNEVYLGEAVARQTPDIVGLVPDYYTLPDRNGLGPWTYDKDLAAMETELRLAMFTQNSVTKSVWDWGGFKLSAYYNLGNEQRRLACESLQAAFNELNAASGKNFQVVPTGFDPMWWWNSQMMPIWFMGWLADFADADNWLRPYMHSYGDFAYYQNYSLANQLTLGPSTGLNKDQLLDLAVKTLDGPQRAAMYADLDYIFVNDIPDIPIAQPVGRRWQWYWVRGWYYNALCPSQYYYKLFKFQTCWADVTGQGGTNSGIPDGLGGNMRDIGYIAGHFGAKSPNPANVPPVPMYDPKWAPGTYGMAGADVYGDRKVDMRDIGFAASHFGHTTQP